MITTSHIRPLTRYLSFLTIAISVTLAALSAGCTDSACRTGRYSQIAGAQAVDLYEATGQPLPEEATICNIDGYLFVVTKHSDRSDLLVFKDDTPLFSKARSTISMNYGWSNSATLSDKDGDGITVGDPIYDTAQGGRGKNGAHGFQIVRVQTADGRQVNATAEVEDGGQELIL